MNENIGKRSVPCGRSTAIDFVDIEPMTNNDEFRDTKGTVLGQGDRRGGSKRCLPKPISNTGTPIVINRSVINSRRFCKRG